MSGNGWSEWEWSQSCKSPAGPFSGFFSCSLDKIRKIQVVRDVALDGRVCPLITLRARVRCATLL